MKSNLYRVGVAAIAIMTSVVSSVGITEAKLQTTGVNQTPRVNPDALKNPQIPQLNVAPFISGEVEFAVGQYGYKAQCKNVKVYLISEEYTEEAAPATKPGEINLGSKIKYIFQYQGKVFSSSAKTDSSNTTYCKYSISADTKFVGKKARLVFETGSVCGSGGDTIIIPDPGKDIKKDYKEKICGIG
jgi:hypothetical protein